ncbi:hypothetical protein KIW84_UN0506 [Lathyrus oleraceus]|nr:hypothetical protein KIW84_UN0506 [Pisum sativum]
MTMGSKESFKEYAQKWRDLAGRVKPPMTDRELVDIERVESGIRSGKIQAATSASTKKPYQGRSESNAVYGQKGHNKKNRDHTIGAITIAGRHLKTSNTDRTDQEGSLPRSI